MKDNIKQKAEYCLNCKNPQCRTGCPLGNNIPAFIQKVKEDNLEEAYKILCETTAIPAICGRICPHQKQCQGKCIRGIKSEPVSIGEIEAYVGDWALNNTNSLLNCCKDIQEKNKKVAVIGGGPSGLTAAVFLRKNGYKVTIYEKQKDLGGILKRGIPEFRLSNEIVEKTIEQILALGINVQCEKELGRNLELANLEKEYDAIYLSIGANIPRKMAIEGEELEGVYGGNSLLENQNHPDYTNKKVAIIGGGNVAMDCARTIKRMGAEQVVVIYRRSEAEMPAESKEISDAKKEGVEFQFLNNIVKILGTNKVEKIECIKTELVQKEGETRKSPVNIENSNYILNMDYVVMAVGGEVDKDLIEKCNISTTTKKYVQVNENNQTSDEKVFAGGDVVGQNSTVAWAASDGKNVASKIIKFLEEK
ncbi:glutamate synthase (NADPH) homotetrameric [Clostridium sp. CAG:567]|nr:glutamate synthase (NADPH) homotetrameric [Clostridium sp. CAG:567]